MKRLSFLAGLMLMAIVTYAQTADEVVQKYIQAIGGAEKWQNLKTLYTEAVAVSQNGQEVNTKLTRIQGKIARREVDFGMGTMKMVLTPDKGWFASPRNSGTFEPMPQGMQAEQSWELDMNPLVDYAAKGSKIELAGKEPVDGKEAYKIKLTSAAGKERTYFIDAASYYLVQESYMGRGERMRGPGGNGGAGGAAGGGGGNGGNAGAGAGAGPTEIKVKYENFQKTPEGLVFPFTVAMGMGPRLNFEKIEINPTVDEKSLMEGVKQ